MFQKANAPVALAVDLVNTWDELEPDPELLRDAAGLKRFLARHGYEPPRLSSRDVAQARALRDALRAAFTARDEEAAVRELNGVLAGSAAKPQFERSGVEWGVRWVGRVSDSVATATAMSLLEAIRDDGWDRFGVCAGAPSRAAPSQAAGRSRQACAATLGHRRGYSSAGRAPGSHPGGRRFEP